MIRFSGIYELTPPSAPGQQPQVVGLSNTRILQPDVNRTQATGGLSHGMWVWYQQDSQTPQLGVVAFDDPTKAAPRQYGLLFTEDDATKYLNSSRALDNHPTAILAKQLTDYVLGLGRSLTPPVQGLDFGQLMELKKTMVNIVQNAHQGVLESFRRQKTAIIAAQPVTQ